MLKESWVVMKLTDDEMEMLLITLRQAQVKRARASRCHHRASAA
jgi:hypothetical protein